MLFTDPIPTPAARAGRAAVVAALLGWVSLAAAGGLYLMSLRAQPDEHLATSFRVACGWAVGPAIVAFLVGTIAAAAGVTRQMNGVPDPGLKVILVGFALNGLPMVLVAMGAAYDKVGRKLIEGKKPKPSAMVAPGLPHYRTYTCAAGNASRSAASVAGGADGDDLQRRGERGAPGRGERAGTPVEVADEFEHFQPGQPVGPGQGVEAGAGVRVQPQPPQAGRVPGGREDGDRVRPAGHFERREPVGRWVGEQNAEVLAAPPAARPGQAGQARERGEHVDHLRRHPVTPALPERQPGEAGDRAGPRQVAQFGPAHPHPSEVEVPRPRQMRARE